MEKNAENGGQPEILALVNVMERPITVHYEDPDKGTAFGEFFKKVNFQPGYMTNVMILISTLSIFHTFPATYHPALLMVCTFHSSLDMQNAAHTMMISDIATSAWLIDFCHKAI